MLSPVEEMKMYCGLLQKEETAADMELEQAPNKTSDRGRRRATSSRREPRKVRTAWARERAISSWSDAIAQVGTATPAADGGQPLQADPSARGCSGSAGPGHSIRALLLQSRTRPARETLEGRQEVERQEGEAAGEHVVEGHHGHVHCGGGDQKGGGMPSQLQRGDDSESLADGALWDAEGLTRSTPARIRFLIVRPSRTSIAWRSFSLYRLWCTACTRFVP